MQLPFFRSSVKGQTPSVVAAKAPFGVLVKGLCKSHAYAQPRGERQGYAGVAVGVGVSVGVGVGVSVGVGVGVGVGEGLIKVRRPFAASVAE